MPKPDFSAFPKPVRQKLLVLRQMIFDVAKKTPGVGELEEALRWRQPSYLTLETGSGSTIRIDQIKNETDKYAMYFICTSGLVEDFKELYKGQMKFEGNRSIVFDVEDRLPEAALRHCISLALTYHLRKQSKTKSNKT
ncbi:MAG TPA: DUF1801 domain-containing protein [Aestuariivirga sp.]|jgi:hypothetical protein|nr:DUF1801 domain-containing protein [Aestuariivirga sp.]